MSHAHMPRIAGAAWLMPSQRRRRQRCPPLLSCCLPLLSGCRQRCPSVLHYALALHRLHNHFQHDCQACLTGLAPSRMLPAAALLLPVAAALCSLPAWRAAMQAGSAHSCSRHWQERLAHPQLDLQSHAVADAGFPAADAASAHLVHPEGHMRCGWTLAGLHLPQAPAGLRLNPPAALAVLCRHALLWRCQLMPAATSRQMRWSCTSAGDGPWHLQGGAADGAMAGVASVQLRCLVGGSAAWRQRRRNQHTRALGACCLPTSS